MTFCKTDHFMQRGSDRKPVPMVEIENLVVESTPLSGTNHLKREPSYRSPTESIYGCYQDQEKTQDAEDEEKKRADGQDRN